MNAERTAIWALLAALAAGALRAYILSDNEINAISIARMTLPSSVDLALREADAALKGESDE